MDIVCLRNMSINTLHKGDDDNNNNNNNNNNNKIIFSALLARYFNRKLADNKTATTYIKRRHMKTQARTRTHIHKKVLATNKQKFGFTTDSVNI